MADFDINSYLNRRYGKTPVTKQDDVKAASAKKREELINFRYGFESGGLPLVEQQAANRESVAGRLNMEPGSASSAIMNSLVASAAAPIEFAGSNVAKALDAVGLEKAATAVEGATNLQDQIGYNPDTGERYSSLQRRILGDSAVSVAKGVVGLGDAVVGVGSLATLGLAGKGWDELGRDSKRTNQFLDSFASPEMATANKNVDEAKGFLATLEAGLDNPSIIPQGIIQSIPSMLGGGAIGKELLGQFPKVAAMVAASPKLSALISKVPGLSAGVAGAIGEGTMMAGNQAEAIRNETADGRLTLKQALLAAGTGVAGAAVGVAGNRLASKLRLGDIDEAIVAGALTKSPRSLVTNVVGSGLVEGGEELLQSGVEQAAKNVALDKPWDEDLGDSMAVGLMTGTPMGMAGGLGQSAKTAAVKQATAKADKEALNAAVASGDVTAYLDPEAPTYSPEKAVSALAGNSQLPDTTPEAKQANLVQATDIVAGLEEKKLELEDKLYQASTEALQAKLDSIQEKLAATDPADTAQVERLTAISEMVAADLADVTGRESANLGVETELSKVDRQINAARQTLVEFNQQMNPADIDVGAQVELIKAPIPENEADAPAAVAAKQAAATSVINLSMDIPERLDATVASELAQDTTNGLTTPQRAYLRAFSEARIAENSLKTGNTVSQNIYTGTKPGAKGTQYVGISQYRERMAVAMKAGNQKEADKQLTGLVKFRDDHQAKAKMAREGMKQGIGQQLLRAADKTWFIATPEQRLDSDAAVKKNGGHTLNSPRMVLEFQTEANALNAATKELEAAYTLTFNKKSATTNGDKDVQNRPQQKADPITQSATEGNQVPASSATVASQNNGNAGNVAAQKAGSGVAVSDGATQETSVSSANTVKAESTQETEGQLQSTGEGTTTAKEVVSQTEKAVTQELPEGVTTDPFAMLKDYVVASTDKFQQTVDGWSKKYAGGTSILVARISKEMMSQLISSTGEKEAGGFYIEVGGQHYIVMNESTKPAQTLGLLAHEFGHALEAIAFANATDGVKTALRKQWAADVSNAKADPKKLSRFMSSSKTAEKLKKAWQSGEGFSLATMMAELGDQAAANEAYAEYLVQFNEWFAEQFSRHITNTIEQQLTPEVQSFWDDLVLKFKEFYEAVIRPLRPNTQFAEWVESLTKPLAEDTATEVMPGQLKLYENKSPEGTEYRERGNLIADFTKQDAGKDDSATFRPLVQVRDFMTQVKLGTVKIIDFLSKEDQTLTSEQSTAIDVFKKAFTAWAPRIQANLIKGRWVNSTKEIKERNKDYLFEDLMQYLVQVTEGNRADLEENVKAAIVYAAIQSIVDENGKGAVNDMETVNRILGRQDDAPFDGIAYDVLSRVGNREDFFRNSAGQKAVAALGIKALKTAPVDLLARLESAFGAHIQKLLMDEGILKRHYVTAQVMSELTGKETKRASTFVRLAWNKDLKLSARVQSIVESNKGSKGILDKLFGVESSMKFPSLTPVKFKQQGVPSSLSKVNNEKQKEENFIREDTFHVLGLINDDLIVEMAGGQLADPDTVQASKRKGMEAKLQGLYRELDRYKEFTQYYLMGSGTKLLSQPFFYEYDVWTNQRIGILNNMFNPQASKMNRFQTYKKSWETKVQLADKSQMDNFMLRVMEGLGHKTDKETNESSLTKFDRFFNTDGASTMQSQKAEALTQAIQVLRKAIYESPESLTLEEQRQIKDGVAAGGENFHSFDSLMAMAHYMQAKEANQTEFTTHIMGEVDGVANGPILAQLLFGGARSLADMVGRMRRGGIFSVGDKFSQYNQWKSSSTSNLDQYEHLTKMIITRTRDIVLKGHPDKKARVVGNLPAVLAAIESFTKPLELDGMIKKAGRDLAKNPLTTMMFGSAVYTSVDRMAEKVIESIYQRIEDANNGVISDSAANIVKDINTLLSAGGGKRNGNLTMQQLMEAEFSKQDIKAIKEAFHGSLGLGAKMVLEDEFSEYLGNRDLLNSTANLVHGLYDAVYRGLRADLIKEVGIPLNAKGVPISDLSKEQEATLQERLADIVPYMATANSIKDGKRENGVRVGKRTKKLNETDTYSGIAHFRTPFSDTVGLVDKNGKSMEAYTVTINSQETVNEGPGAGMNSKSTHSFDSAVSHDALAGNNEVTNVHDAHVVGLNGFLVAGKRLNKALWENMLAYSPMYEAAHSLENMVQAINTLAKNGQLPDSVLNNLKEVLEQQADKNEISARSVLPFALIDMYSSAFKADALKLQFLEQASAFDQYASEGGNYLVTDTDRAAASAKLKDLVATPDAKQIDAIHALNTAVFGVGTKPAVAPAAKTAEVKNTPALNVDIPTEVEAIESYTTMEIHEALDTRSLDPAFQDHLRTVLAEIVQKLHGPFDTFLEGFKRTAATTPLDAWLKAQETGLAPFASAIPANLGVSAQELFVIEQIEATVRASLLDSEAQSKAAYSELSKLYTEVAAKLKPSDFASQEEYDFIFDIQGGNGDRSDYLSRFAALGLAHQGFNKLLQVATKRDTRSVRGAKSFGERVQIVFENILAFFNTKITKTYEGQRADSKLEALIGQLVDIEAKKRSTLKRRATETNFLLPVEEGARAVTEAIRNKVGDLAGSDFIRNNASGFVRGAGAVARTIAKDQVEAFLETIQQMRDAEFKGRQGILAGLITGFKGPLDEFNKLLRFTKKREGERKTIITNLSKQVLEVFANKGKDMTKEAKAAVSAVFLRSGAHYLLDHFSLQEIQKLVSDQAEVTAQIKVFEAKLTSPLKNDHIAQANGLGLFKATGLVKVDNLMLNAHLIARMAGTTQASQITAEQAQQEEKTIQALISLYSLKYQSEVSLVNAETVFQTENARTDGNGIEFLLSLHKQLEQESLDRLFKGNPALMQHGYVPEILNPHTAFVVATEEEGKDLEAQGYKKGGQVTNDRADPDQAKKHIYVVRDGGLAPYLSGVFSLSDMKAKGKMKINGNLNPNTLIGLDNAQLMAKIGGQKARAMQANRSKNPSRDLTTEEGNFLVPEFNDKGQIVNYRYMMSEGNRNLLLERNNDFDKLMGVLSGSIFDKETTKEQNEKAIEALLKQYQSRDRIEDPAYVMISPKSDDAEFRQIWNMLPEATKKDVRKVWGKDQMWVRSDSLDIMFGYRKLSVSDMFRRDPEARNALEKLIVGVFETYGARLKGMDEREVNNFVKRVGLALTRGERAWQELVGETKDILVVKTGLVMIGNIWSNLSLLAMQGVPLKDILHHHLVALKGATSYQYDKREVQRLQTLLDTKMTGGKDTEIKRQILRLKDALARNPVRELIEAGLMPTIVEDVASDEDQYSYKSYLTKKVEGFTDKLNPTIVAAGKVVYMTHDTKMYQGLSRITQLSDFVARYTLYQHLLTRKNLPLDKEAAVQEASDAFVNYDIPMHRGMQYMDDMGITMFTKYFLRIQKVLLKLGRENPARVLMTLALNNYLDLGTIVLDGSFVGKLGNNPFGLGALKYPGTLDDLATVNTAMALIK